MKRSMSLLSFSLCLAVNAASAADLRVENPQLYAELRDTTFSPLFQALSAGDVAEIKRYISGETYAQYRVLLDQNRTYGQFLRNYYAGAGFELSQVTPVTPAGSDYVADVLIYWPNGSTSTIKLQVHGVPDSTRTTGMHQMAPVRGARTHWTVGAPVDGSRGKQGN
jgi:hypothetical protein